MTYKLLVSDLDETLLNDQGVVPQTNIEALKKAIALGVKFVPNTGRPYTTVQNLLQQLGLEEAAGQYVISYNGGIITENQGNRILSQTGLEQSLAEKIFHAGLINDQVGVHIYTLHYLYIYNLSSRDALHLQQRQIPFENLVTPSFPQIAANDLILKVIFESTDLAVQQAVEDQVLKIVGRDNVTPSRSSNCYVEFNPPRVDKGSATLRLASQLGIDRTEVIGVGDNNNDLSLIQAAGCGIAVQNALPEVKACAQVVLQNDNNRGALAEIVERFILHDK
ncbi:HAD family phosphatase [Lactobacillus sp. DCY120]|uniref:HAD family phosphatase n=1 Tax=Bombilactobacillus apium TaxID=2675299 RepID=A0A850R5W2_9LACO|nr:Cof-type HAD-IIB family hydrolase [Bombilactobacillus apium]NVY96012.1 HAD family phosphatase [Bombilactobacillus apium]